MREIRRAVASRTGRLSRLARVRFALSLWANFEHLDHFARLKQSVAIGGRCRGYQCEGIGVGWRRPATAPV